MSTTISISTGALSASRTFANDTKAQATMLAFYEAYNLGPGTASPAVKLQAVVDFLIGLMVEKARLLYTEKARTAAMSGAEITYGLMD